METVRNTLPMERHTSVIGSMTQGLVKVSLTGPMVIDMREDVRKYLVIIGIMMKCLLNHSRRKERTNTGTIQG